MKKIFSALTAILIAAGLAACESRSAENLSKSQSQNTSDSASDMSDSLESSSSAEAQKPAGEPTFLLCPDGVPVYTSEITEIYSGSDEFNDKKPASFSEAERGIRGGEEEFAVRCDGFTYGYIPAPALNCVDNPDMFKKSGSVFEYIGESEEDTKDGGLTNTEFIRLKNEDRFGTLTVKNAYIVFGTNFELFGGDPEAPGACVIKRGIEFDGEVELEGYICVTPTDTLYGMGGDMRFYPNAESSVKIPVLGGAWRFEYGKFCSVAYPDSSGYFGGLTLNVGNIHETGFDVSGVSDGDSFIKAKVTIENIKYSDRLKFDIKYLEIM